MSAVIRSENEIQKGFSASSLRLAAGAFLLPIMGLYVQLWTWVIGAGDSGF
jgi:hypothetical protein